MHVKVRITKYKHVYVHARHVDKKRDLYIDISQMMMLMLLTPMMLMLIGVRDLISRAEQFRWIRTAQGHPPSVHLASRRIL